jgi:hypothetical protein
MAQTGNPLADGWTAGGHSMKNGNYNRCLGRFSFVLYTKIFTVQSGDAFTASVGGNAWAVGDQVLALGRSLSHHRLAELMVGLHTRRGHSTMPLVQVCGW